MTPSNRHQWHRPVDKLPENGRKVVWLDSAGTEVDGEFHSGHWWITNDMHIYYVPTFWRYDEK